MTGSLRIDFHLLDRQIVDLAGVPVGKVDDVELTEDGLRVVALLSGMDVLGRRMGGWLGRSLVRLAARWGPPEPVRIPWEFVSGVDSAVHLSLRREVLDEPKLEKWLRDSVISRIPGAGDASQ
jgi:sporulation protein YlmC with PRC-barrel domain